MTRPFAAAAALAVAALFVSPVSAAPSGPSWDAGYRVAYGDLELGTIEGGIALIAASTAPAAPPAVTARA